MKNINLYKHVEELVLTHFFTFFHILFHQEKDMEEGEVYTEESILSLGYLDHLLLEWIRIWKKVKNFKWKSEIEENL